MKNIWLHMLAAFTLLFAFVSSIGLAVLLDIFLSRHESLIETIIVGYVVASSIASILIIGRVIQVLSPKEMWLQFLCDNALVRCSGEGHGHF
jgi:hypothetical protein